MTREEILNHEIDKIIRMQQSLLGYSCPIMMKDFRGYAAIGSGCLLSFNGNYFIATATHVCDAFNGNPMYLLREKYSPFRAHLKFVAAIEKRTEINSVDCCFAKISPEEVSFLMEKWRFWDSSQSFDRRYITDQYVYTLVGYPNTRNKFKGEIDPLAYSLSKFEASIEIYNKYGIDPKMNLMLEFDPDDCMLIHKEMHNNQIMLKFPKANGISGCPVWVTADFANKDSIVIPPVLIGIIKAQTEDKKYLIATKSEVACHGIRSFQF